MGNMKAFQTYPGVGMEYRRRSSSVNDVDSSLPGLKTFSLSNLRRLKQAQIIAAGL